MSTGQIIVYLLIGFVLLAWARRWMARRGVREYTPREVAERVRAGALLLDVRTETERKSGAIRGSVHIPLQELRGRADELDHLKGREIVCFCRSGNRSVMAASILTRRGHTAASMKGGLVEWNFSRLT